MSLEDRALATLAPFVTVRRAALWSNVFVVVVVALAVVRLFTSAHPLAEGDVGGDFRGFYYAGEYARSGQSAHLYDRIEEILRGGRVETPFMHPPIVALLFAPISLLPYPVALALFVVVSIGCWLFACTILEAE
ncbi:MAG TPA: glycosyltransferase 87 family protein, partial [Polyangiaceae bacterium]